MVRSRNEDENEGKENRTDVLNAPTGELWSQSDPMSMLRYQNTRSHGNDETCFDTRTRIRPLDFYEVGRGHWVSEWQHTKEKELPSPRRSSNDGVGRSWPWTCLGHKLTPLILQYSHSHSVYSPNQQ